MIVLYTADFETTVNTNDCRVWAYALFEIGSNDNFIYGNSIDGFMDWCMYHEKETVYFHNLKFDGEFIISWLLNNGYAYVKKKKAHETLKTPKTFTTLISDKGMFYSLEICWETKFKQDTFNFTRIYDSLKILPFSVEKIAKGFNLPISKLKIDYKEFREKGHKLTKQEIDYIRNDVEIVARALNILFEQKLTKMTQGSNALFDYKRIVGKNNFKKAFPILDYDDEIRKAYKGGFTYLAPRYKNKEVGEGIVLDVNSLYPSRMYDCLLPFGEGVKFEGKYQFDKDYPLFVQKLSCSFRVKDKHIPTIQLKNHMGFCPTEYLESSENEDIVMSLCNPDLSLLIEHYNVKNVEWMGGWKFKGRNDMFRDYIDKWFQVKAEATISGNESMRTLAKLMLNALYGKFGLNPNVSSKIPWMDDRGIVHYQKGEDEKREPIYIPVAAFITSYARHLTITSAQKVYDRFIYADTDSLHLEGTDIPQELEIDSVKLGAWKHESTFERARFLRQKSYVEQVKGKLNVTCAGMPKDCHAFVNWDNFSVGATFHGKLRPVHCPGGIVLVDTPFTIKA